MDDAAVLVLYKSSVDFGPMLAMFAWGILMMAQARQPAWVEAAGKAAWVRVRPVLLAPGGSFAAGLVHALCWYLPCWWRPEQQCSPRCTLCWRLPWGAGCGCCRAMAGACAITLNGWRDSWGTRFAGLLLFASRITLWMDLVYSPLCGAVDILAAGAAVVSC